MYITKSILMPSVRQRAETNKRNRTNREENYVIQEQDRKPNWKNKQTRKISKELNKANMWLPYPAQRLHLAPTCPISELGSEVLGISSLKYCRGCMLGYPGSWYTASETLYHRRSTKSDNTDADERS